MINTTDRNKRWIARLERAASVTGFRAQMLKPRPCEHAPRWVYYVGKAA